MAVEALALSALLIVERVEEPAISKGRYEFPRKSCAQKLKDQVSMRQCSPLCQKAINK